MACVDVHVVAVISDCVAWGSMAILQSSSRLIVIKLDTQAVEPPVKVPFNHNQLM